MSFEERFASYFGLRDTKDWLPHANPLSAWGRMPVLPLLVLTLWSRQWFGGIVLFPVLLLLLWTFLNPVFFSPPATTKSWISRAVLGEKIWMNREKIPVESHHETAISRLVWIQIAGVLLLGYGTYYFVGWFVIYGLTIVLLAKFWFLDRMVWVFQDLHTHSEYRKLLY